MRDAARSFWAEDDGSGVVIPFPRERLRRFIAVQFISRKQWRAGIFAGWHMVSPDPMLVTTCGEALSRARRCAARLGLPLIDDRCSILGGDVLEVPR